MRALAALPEVLWIEQLVPGGPSDERQALAAAGQVYFDGSATRPNAPAAYPGAYQLWLESKGFCTSTKTTNCTNYWTRVAVFDSGLDVNICGSNGRDCLGAGDIRTRHPDLNAREFRFFCAGPGNPPQPACYGLSGYPGRYVYSDGFGHGTAVAGVLAADPAAGVGVQMPSAAVDQGNYYLGSGVAPLAQLVTYRLWADGGGSLIGRDYGPDDIEVYHRQIYNTVGPHVVRIANHSWNNWVTGYTTLSQRFDQLVRDSDGGFDQSDRAITLVVASGNSQSPYCSSPSSPPALTYAPANAKNVISVGAVENWRTSDYSSYPWPTTCGAADSLSNVACYSRRGVATDVNRFKPDLVAPGTRIGSAFTRSASPTGFGCFVMPGANDPNGGYYVRTVGTSFAAPVVTGAAVLAETWYYSKTGQIPSPAMLKAMLVAHADDLAGGSDRMTALTLGHRPSMAQGWGRVNLDRLFQTAAPVTFLDEDHGTPRVRRFLQGDPGWSKTFQVGNTGLTEVILVMAFTDAPAAVNASPLYVNDNNLYVLQGGWSYRGNYFDSAAFSVRSGGLPDPWLTDPHNNVEMLRIRVSELAPTYQFTVEVTGGPNASAVPGLLEGNVPNQDFALYVYNATQVP